MTAQTLTLPYARTSSLHIERRDLVLSAADNLLLRVVLVEQDDPDALPITMTGAVGGPQCSLVIYPDSDWHRWDYGAPQMAPGSTLWSGAGVLTTEGGNSFDIEIPAGAAAAWPRRCSWAVLLGAGSTEMLAEGYLHIRPSVQAPPHTVAPPIVPPTGPTVAPIVEVVFTLDRDGLSMGAMLAGGSDGIKGQPGGVGEPLFLMDVTHMDTWGAVI